MISHRMRRPHTPKQVISIGCSASPAPRIAPEKISIKTNVKYDGARIMKKFAPMRTTASSPVKKRSSGSRNTKSSALSTIVVPSAIKSPTRVQRLTRS